MPQREHALPCTEIYDAVSTEIKGHHAPVPGFQRLMGGVVNIRANKKGLLSQEAFFVMDKAGGERP